MKYIITMDVESHEEFVMRKGVVCELYDSFKTDTVYLVRGLDGETDDVYGEFATLEEAEAFVKEKEDEDNSL